MVLALMATPDPAPSAPPTIITTKTSRLCTAIRDVIAPALVYLRDQDEGFAADGPSLGAGGVVHMRVENDILKLADDNIKANQALDKLVVLDLADAKEKQDVRVLEQTMRAVAKLQNEELNQLSGTEYTNDYYDLAGFSNPMSGEEQLRPKLPVISHVELIPAMPSMESIARSNLRILRQATAQREAAVAAALQPIVERCR